MIVSDDVTSSTHGTEMLRREYVAWGIRGLLLLQGLECPALTKEMQQ